MEPWLAMLVGVGLSGAFFLFFRWFDRKLSPKKLTIAPISNNHVYDKSKYHHETIKELGLPEAHASHLATFFLSWLIKNKLTSDWFERTGGRKLKLYRTGKLSIKDLYDQVYDGCLLSGMLTDEGNAFATAYFDFLNGRYFSDYTAHLQGLPSEFHVEYTQENEQLIHGVIDERFHVWKRLNIV